MRMEPENNGGFDWSTLWTRAFVLAVMFMLGVNIYTIFRVREEINNRRHAACVSENESSRRQRELWDRIIETSQRSEEKAFVFVGTKKFPVVFERVDNDEQIAWSKKFIKEANPIRDCTSIPPPLPFVPTPTPVRTP